jgi:alpha-ketoglutarate-dependent taurine dioxygenase
MLRKDWHMDGTLDDVPHLAAVTTAVVGADADGGTEFADTAAAFATFGAPEQARLSALRVVHGHASHQRRVHPDTLPEQEARWAAESTDPLDDLLARATRPEFVYRHDWTEGDLVIWDNQALLHRACPYELTSPRELHRTHVGGGTPSG